ncbi:MAG: urate hydroxylase PuuD [Myxococcaceae bacterium]
MSAAFVQEWLNLVVRWVHVIAGIMWIGDSFLFMWLDSHLSKPSRPRDGDVSGELWMTHSGGFYEVIKRKSLGKDEMPGTLYWFKWESYTTWITGFLLLIIVYNLNQAALLIDPSVRILEPWQATLISLGLPFVAFAFYEGLWQTPLKNSQKAFAGVGLLLIAGLAYGLTHIFSARGAFLQVGATVGTIMTFNVFFRIIPAQRHMLEMTKAGTPVDTSYGARAKGRSIQNHYLTLPVLFTMLSNHFPSVYGVKEPWIVLTLMFVVGAGLKYFMNKRTETHPVALIGTVAALASVVFLTRPAGIDFGGGDLAGKPTDSFATVQAIVDARCINCHAPKPSSPMFPAPPLGITFDSPENIARHADRMYVRAVATKTMPLGNMTGMTDEEREFLGAWFQQGADIKAEGPSQLGAIAKAPEQNTLPNALAGVGDAGAGSTDAGEDPARAYFGMVCISCHGAAGQGDGLAAAALNPKPRNFTDPEWQKSVTDEHLKKIILEGGAAVGKSPMMPPNPGLADQPATVDGLVKLIRAFGKKS